MNKKVSAMLTTAVVSGLIAAQAGHAEENKEGKSADAPAAEKQKCKTAHGEGKNKKAATKNSCGGKSGCGQKTEKPAEGK